jgi:Uma2 family endonuclease
MATVVNQPALTSGVVFHGVTWDDYEAMLRIVGNRPIRVTYDCGEMEVMSPTWRHNNGSYLLGWMVDILVVELDIPCEPADAVTLNRPDLEKGVEPDKLYYFRDNAPRIRGKRHIHMNIDPPPDLVIESELTSSSVPRLPIFAALGIPEVWRLEEDELHFLQLQPEGTYQPKDHSLAFPVFSLADASRFLDEGQVSDKTAWIRSFQVFVRDHYVPQDPAIDPA